MRHIFVVSAFVLCLTAANAQTADELVNKNIEAKGGMAAIKTITSLRMTGRLETQGIVLLIGSDQKPEDLVRQTGTIQGMTQIQAFDGAVSWQINPFSGRRDPERMGEDDTRDMVESADFYGPLVDYQRKGSTVEYLGHTSVDGDDALLLKVTLKNGDILKYFLDPDTYLEIRTEKQMFIRGSVHESFNNLGSYKKVNGVYYPFTVETGSSRRPTDLQKITYSRIEANVAIPNAEFMMPEKTAPSAEVRDPGSAKTKPPGQR